MGTHPSLSVRVCLSYQIRMLPRPRALPAGFIPAVPADQSAEAALRRPLAARSGSLPRKNGDRVRLYSRPGNDLITRFPLTVEALARLRSRSCIIDGEAVACDESGLADAQGRARQ